MLDADGNAVASAESAEGTIHHPGSASLEPRPGTPYLYTLHATCGADVYDQTFGVRSIEVRGTQVLLNGKPLYFKGFCKHEDFTAHGRGFDPVLNVKDVNLIHWANANAVRTSTIPTPRSSTTCATGRAFWSWTRPRRWASAAGQR